MTNEKCTACGGTINVCEFCGKCPQCQDIRDHPYEIKTDDRYVIWKRTDPRILGDNYSEVSREIVEVGSEEIMMRSYHRYKAMKKVSGNDAIGYGYPVIAKEGDKVGDKIVEHKAKTEPDDDDFHDQNEDVDTDYQENYGW